MKKRQQWMTGLILAALAIGINLGASAVDKPTLTQVWKNSTTMPAHADARQGAYYGGKVYTLDKGTKKLISWDKDNRSEMVLDKADGVGINFDQAGNLVLRNEYFAGANPGAFILYPNGKYNEKGTPLAIKLSDPAQANNIGKIKGNILDATTGGKMYFLCKGKAAIEEVTIVGGKQVGESKKIATTVVPDGDGTAIVHYYDNNEVIINSRTASSKVTRHDGIKESELKTSSSNPRNASIGCDMVKLSGIEYLVYPSGTNYSDEFTIVNQTTGEAVATHAKEGSVASASSLGNWVYAEKVNEFKANIYQYSAGNFAAMYTFEIPAPVYDDYYIIGAVEGQGWAADKGTALTTEDGKTYTGKIKFADGDKTYVTFALTTKLGATADDWASVADFRKGPQVDGTIINLVNTSGSAIKSGNAFSINAGEYDITLDAQYGTITLIPTSPNPVVFPDNVYLIGEIGGISAWQPNSGLMLEKTSDGVYTGTFSCAENANFAIVEKLGVGTEQADWDLVNSLRYGFDASNKVLAVGNTVKIYRNSNTGQLAAGSYKLMVNLNTSEIKLEEGPAPAPEQLYIIGEVDGVETWKPNSGLKLEKKEDGTYTGRATFNANGGWGIVEQLGADAEDWNTVNAHRYGPAKDMELVKKGVATAISMGTNAFKILVGTYDVTVDLDAKTVLCEQVVTSSDRAVYAYGLTAVEDGTDYVLTYNLNTAAKDVTVKVTDKDGAQVGELIEAPVKAGVNSVRIAKAGYPGENLSWEVSASGTAIESYNLITPKTMDFAGYAVYGIDVDKNPESKNFGYVYVTNSGKGSCKKPDGAVECLQGLYVYTPALERVKIGDKTVFTGGITFETANTYCDPRNVKVANDGSIFIGCNSLTHTSLYRINPSDFDVWEPVFEGTQNNETGIITDKDNNFIAGGTIAMSFTGEGNDQQLFVLGSKNRATSFSINDMFMSVYNIGYKSKWNSAPSKVLSAPAGMTNTQANTICADGKGGYWVAQHRAGGNSTEPTVMHFDQEGNRDYAKFSADAEIPNFCAGGGMAINKEGTLMAISNSGAGAATKGAIAVYTVSYDEQNVPMLTFVESFMTELSTNINEIAFDYAGNIHAVSNSGEWYMAYSGKKAENKETVKCSIENQLNSNRVCNEPTNLAGQVVKAEKCVALTWDAPADSEAPLYYIVSATCGDDAEVFDGIADASFKHYPSSDNRATYTYVVTAVYAGDIAKPGTSIDVFYDISVSVDDINSDAVKSKVYPNPTTGIVNIESAAGIYKVEIFNGSSQMIEQVNVPGEEKTQLDITGQPSGVYFIKVNDKAVIKVIKK